MRHNQFTQISTLLLVSFIIMMLIRLTLYNFYIDDFSNLTQSEFYLSLFMGLRVDMITLFTFSSVFILLLFFIKNIHLRKSIALIWAVVLNTIFLFSFGDVLYYDYIHRHMSSEVFNLSNDMDIIIGMAFGSMLFYTIGTSLLSILFIYFVYKFFAKETNNFIVGKKLALFSLISILFIFMGIRNAVGGKSFGISDAYAVNKVSSGNLALNGFFTIYRTAKQTAKHDLMELNKAIALTKKALTTPKALFTNSEYPLQRHYKKENKKQHNIVVILLESFGAEHIDGFTKYKELGATPYFKKLSQEGLKFDNFYANGYRSIFGVTSIFTGITIPSGFEYLGKGLELSNLNYLGTVAKDNGYDTLSIQASHRRSYRIDSVSTLAGFNQYFGSEDIPNVEIVDAGRKPITGTYDYNMLDFYHKKLNKMKEPFLGFAFTASTHSDYHLPSKKYEQYPHDLKNYNGYLNALKYTDHSLERFMEDVKNEPWFDNTIFIITSDHGNSDALNPIAKKYRPHDKALPSIEHFRIPLVIYAPEIFKPQVIKTLGSQNDIFPSIVDMLGFEANITVMGNSLFDTNIQDRFVYFYAGNILGLITDDGYIKYNFKNIVESSTNQFDINKTKNLLFGLDTAQAQLLKTNKWAR